MIQISISPGEAYDRMSILHIKMEKISDEEKVAKVKEQFGLLWEEINLYNGTVEVDEDAVSDQYRDLIAINTKLWDIEDDIRECESQLDFGSKFIELARAVYHTNDERHEAKLAIDTLYKSELAEQKEYTDYEKDRTLGESI